MVGGRGVRLLETSAVTHSDLFVCVDLDDAGGTEALVRLASSVQHQWLPPESLRATTEVSFDHQRQRVVAIRRTWFGDLAIEESQTNIPPNADAGAILAREAAAHFDLHKVIDEETRQFIIRVQCLAQWMPELNLPDWNEHLIAALLPDLCVGKTSLDELRCTPLLPILQSKLNPAQFAAVQREAPSHFTVPSDSRIALDYQPGKPPILAVRIQEIFGLRQTPRIAGGRVPIVLHLLAPNMRLQQVTADLASFWRTAYAEVRKELRRRYPKHAWPEDPLTAQPQRRPQRKR